MKTDLKAISDIAQEALNQGQYPYIIKGKNYIINVRGKEISIPIPEISVIKFELSYMEIKRLAPNEICDVILSCTDKLKKFCKIENEWIGEIKITDFSHSGTTAAMFAYITGSLVPIDKILHDVEFDNKLMDIIE